MATESKPATGDVINLREENLRHETAITLVGMLYYVAAGMLIAAAITSLAMTKGTAAAVRFASMLGLLAAGFGFSGYLLRRLDMRARYAASMMAVLGMLAVPIGTILNGYVLWLVHSKKGRVVISPEYREVVAKTPQIKCRATNAMLGLGIALVGVAVYRVLQLVLQG